MLSVTDTIAPAADRALGFAVPARDARGRLVRLDASLNAILSAHDYPAPLARLLGEALVLTALLGATLRDGAGGGLTMQAQAGGGAVDLLVCDYHAGQLRGYLRVADADKAVDGVDLPTLFGGGHLAITLDPTEASERYQGIVPLEGASLTAAVEDYFRNSEQLPTLVRAAVTGDAATGWSAGGMLLQYLPKGEIGGERHIIRDDSGPELADWQHMRVLAGTVTPAELTDPALSFETLLWRLFHEEEVRIAETVAPSRGCRCSAVHVRDVLARFPAEELATMRRDDGTIGVDCQFCARTFTGDL